MSRVYYFFYLILFYFVSGLHFEGFKFFLFCWCNVSSNMHWLIYLSNVFISVSVCGEKHSRVWALDKVSDCKSFQQLHVLMSSQVLTAVFHVQQPRHSAAPEGVSRSGFSRSGFAKGVVKQGHLCYAVRSLPLLYCASLADECIFNRIWDLMKGANIHRHSSLSLPWCCCFPFSSHFKVLNLSPDIRVCHSLMCQHTKPTDKLLLQKKEKKLFFFHLVS